MQTNHAYIGIGANLGHALQQVTDAIALMDTKGTIRVTTVSSFYRTEPIDSSGDDYINAVFKIETSLDADDLLTQLFDIEQQFGRERPYYNAPRTLDLDLLMFNDEVRTTPRLTLPHPRMHERAFVLIPLIEIAPGIVIPGRGAATAFVAAVSNQRIQKL